MKKFISAITAIAMTAGVMASMTVVANAEMTGNGTEDDPWVINGTDDLYDALTKSGSYKVSDSVRELDCTSESTKITANIDLDFNGATLKTNTNGLEFGTATDVTLKNGTIIGQNYYAVRIISSTPAKVTLDGINTSGGGNGVLVDKAAHNVEINGGKINGTTNGIHITGGNTIVKGNTEVDGATSGILLEGSGNINVENGIVKGSNYALNMQSTGTANLSGTKLINSGRSNAVIYAKSISGSIELTQCIAQNDNSENKAPSLAQQGNPDTTNLIINSGTYHVNINKSGGCIVGGTFTVKGGTFIDNPSAYVDAGQYEVKEDPSGTWTVSKKGEVEPPIETKYYKVDLGDNAGSYTKVSVTANNGGEPKTVTKPILTTVTVAEGAGVSLGIEITDIPTDGTGTFNITSVTLE